MPTKGEPVPRLLEWRRARLLTQAELAEMSGVARTTIARIEAGAPAQFSTIRKLARALQLAPAELLGSGRAGGS
jgi:transcriptional regulator with XRE-family HTH domain